MEKNFHLPKDFAKKWIAALRSGKYKQGSGKYYDSKLDCYCAMGVGYKANDVPFAMDGQTINSEYDRVFMFNGENNLLWFPLQEMNDDEKLSFKEIADWVETNVEFI